MKSRLTPPIGGEAATSRGVCLCVFVFVFVCVFVSPSLTPTLTLILILSLSVSDSSCCPGQDTGCGSRACRSYRGGREWRKLLSHNEYPGWRRGTKATQADDSPILPSTGVCRATHSISHENHLALFI
jgi:hypothetical protein